MDGFRVIHTSRVAGAAFENTLGHGVPVTTLQYNSAMVEMLKVVDGLSNPAAYFKRGALGRVYAGFEAQDAQGASTEIPIVGLSSVQGGVPSYWLDVAVAPQGPASPDSDRRMWGLALMMVILRYGQFWRLIRQPTSTAPTPGATAGAGVVYSTELLESGAGAVAVPRELAEVFAPDRVTDKVTEGPREVVFAAPFDPACHNGSGVYAGALAFQVRLSTFLRTGEAMAPLGPENDLAARAEATELAGQMQAMLRRGDRRALMFFGGAVAGVAAIGISRAVLYVRARRAAHRKANRSLVESLLRG